MRLSEYRRHQTWPPIIVAGEGWNTLYAAAIEDIEVLPDVDAAVTYANDFVQRIAEEAAVRNGSTVID